MVKKIHFKNQIFSKKELKNVIYDAYTDYGIKRASSLADEMKEIGFHYATKAGISISIEDLKIPPSKKNLLFFANKEITNSDLAYARGEITSVERFQKVLDTWNKASESLKNNLVDYFRQTDPFKFNISNGIFRCSRKFISSPSSRWYAWFNVGSKWPNY